MVKLNKEGKVVFEKWLPYFVAGSDTKPLSIQKTSDGNFIIAGTVVQLFENKTQFYLAKVDPNGEEIWTKVFAPRDYARGFDVKEVSGGYVAVGYEGSWDSKWSDIYVVKVNPEGHILWESFYGDVESDHGYSVAVGPNGNIYVAGYVTTLNGDKDFAILEYDNNGNLLSEKSLGGYGDDVAYAIDIDDNGNLYVAGYSQSSDLGADAHKDVFILKYTVK
nr:SBBP repeat-containing protein [Petrotoga sp. 8T1HF07.NaAc.6.1]